MMIPMRLITAALTVVVVLAIHADSSADVVTHAISGTITSVVDTSAPANNVGGIVPGSTFSGTFSFQTIGTDLDPSPGAGLYFTPGLVAYDLFIGGIHFVGNSSTQHGAVTGNNITNQFGNSVDAFEITQSAVNPPGWGSTSPFGRLWVLFYDTTGTAQVDDTLPQTFSMSNYDKAFINLQYFNSVTFPGGSDSSVDILGEITLTTVPEPGSSFIFCIVAAAGLVSSRRRRMAQA